ncbi:MAG: enoyl-CoA hydratase [Pseudomonadota bacterium]
MDASVPPYVRVTDDGGVRTITLNRPAQRNLLTREMIAALSDALDAPAARVIVIASEGPAFCVGHDMKEMAAHHSDKDGGRAYFTELFAECGALMGKIAKVPQPVIASVHSTAVAAGCQLVAACDLAIAADNVSFGTTGVTFGLYCSTPAVPLTRSVAAKHAAEMLMTGELVNAAHAERIGLINRAVPAQELGAEVAALAARIAAHSPAVVALGKGSVTRTRGLSLDEAYALAAEAMVENLLLEDGREGLAAFAEKRPGVWRNLPGDKSTVWNERYATHTNPFGDAPNAYLAAVTSRLPEGRAFFAADGEGRNARHLASKGWTVTMNDMSWVAADHARTRAQRAGLTIAVREGNLVVEPPEADRYDVVGAFYLHLPPNERRAVHAHLARALAPGGVLVIEAFSKAQIGYRERYQSGGPSKLEALYSAEDLREDFAGLVPLELEETETELAEGTFHSGPAAVVRGLFQRAP